MWMANGKSLRIQIPPDMIQQWEDFCEKKKIKQQPVIESMLRWLLDQNDVAQSMILGQIEPTPELLKMVLAPKQPAIRRTKTGGVVVNLREQ